MAKQSAIALELGLTQAELDKFTAAISHLQRSTQRDVRTAFRIGVIDMLKSIRKQTRVAHKLRPRTAFAIDRQQQPPYITTGNGKIHRAMVWFHANTSRRLMKGGNYHWYEEVGIKYNSRRTKSGGIAESWKEETEAQLITKARRRHKIFNRGLYRHSWGWFLWRLFNIRTQDDFHNKRVRLSHRHVEGGITEKREPLPDGTIDVYAPIKCDVTIINRMRGMRRALPSGAISLAIEKAVKGIMWKAEKAVKSSQFD